MHDVAEALEGLKSYDLEVTKEALGWLVTRGEVTALEAVLPLTQHPDVAIRHFAKRAVAALRSLLPAGDVRTSPSASLTGASLRRPADELAPRSAARRRLPFFKLEVVI